MVEQRNVGAIRQSMCGFSGRTPKVCCPNEEEEEATNSPEFKGYVRDIPLLTPPKTSNETDTTATVSQPPRLYSNETVKNARRAGTSPFPAGDLLFYSSVIHDKIRK